MIRYIFIIFFLLKFFIGNSQEHNDSIRKKEKLIPIYISSISDYRKEGNSAIVTSSIHAKQIENFAKNKDLPELLIQTPSVYVTKQGGGYGDSRINIRGFDQRNIAVTINGVPINDMESGWVYWSNWMNLTNIASSIQVQRGLGASKLALPSVGGSINIYTHAAQKTPKKTLNIFYGNEGFTKEIFSYDTGIMNNNLAVSLMLSHYKGKGYIEMTQGEAFGYFLNLDYQMNDHHQFMFTIFGGPQWHNQKNKAPELNDYLKYSSNAKPNIRYNQEWGYLHGKAFTWSRNFFHKPIASLNWDYQINDKWELISVFYGAWGKGGGTGPIGSINYQYPDSKIYLNPNGHIRFDDIYTWNSGGNIPDFGPDRTNNNGLFLNNINTGLTRFAFMNNHAWYGMISNIHNKINDHFRWNTGVDMRYTTAKNSLTVNNVLGADGYIDNFDNNQPDKIIFPEDFIKAYPSWNSFESIDNLKKIVFYNGSKVRWLGLFAQSFYTGEKFHMFLQGGISNQQYQRIDYFQLPDKQKSLWIGKWGGNIKSGTLFQLNSTQKLYANTGFFSKQPLFKAVFPKWNSNEANERIENEKVYSAESGYIFNNRKHQFRLNFYTTSWKNRMIIVNDFINNQQVTGNLYGINESHKGLEVESQLKFKPISISTMISFGNWHYQGNIKNVKLYNFQQQIIATKNYYLDKVKVGNAPEFSADYQINYKFNKNIQLTYNQYFVNNLYAEIDASNFSNPHHKGSLKLPAYSLSNLNINFQKKWKKFGKVKINLAINNLFNKKYISESKTNFFPDDNSATWNGVNKKNRVFFGWGRNFNVNLSYEF